MEPMSPCLTAAAAALLLLSAAGTPPANRAPREFVRVKGTRFVIGDRPFSFVGANAGVMHGVTQRRRYRETLAAVRRDGLRVVRIWAFGEVAADAPRWHRRWQAFRAGPRGWIPRTGRHLDAVLAEARQLGLRVILVLGNNWGDYGGIPQYLRWARLGRGAGFGKLDRFYRHPRTRRWYRWHVARLLGRRSSLTGRRLARDPTIMAWELINESRVTAGGFAARRGFIRSIATLIRKHAPRHLVGAGVTGYDGMRRRAEWLRVCRMTAVSYCDAHLYPEQSWRLRKPADLARQIDDRVQLAHHVAGKPVLFGEFGFSREIAKRTDLGRGSRRPAAWWTHRFLSRVYRDGATGALIWIYLPHSHEQRRFPVWVDRPHTGSRGIRRVMRRWARRFSAGPPRRINPRLGPQRGRAPLYAPQFTVRRAPPTASQWERASARGWRLRVPIRGFVRARFYGMGYYGRGKVKHVWGRRHGYWEYRVPRSPVRLAHLTVRLRLSSEYPGADAPVWGLSPVEIRLGGRPIARLAAPPDDGVGVPVTLRVTRRDLLSRLHHQALRLRLRVPASPFGHGLCVYGPLGTRGRKATPPIPGPLGPILLQGTPVGAPQPPRRPTPR